jgi:hypothetical protein
MRSPKFIELFENEKIIIRGSSGLLRILAIYDNRNIYTSHKCTLIINLCDLPKTHKQYNESSKINLKYLLGIINSRLIDFYYESVYGGFIDVYPNNLKELPIKIAYKEIQSHFVAIVDFILFLKKQNKESYFFENLIDAMVYELYLHDKIQVANCEILKHLTKLPELLEGDDEATVIKNLEIIEEVYQELSDPAHPVNIAMARMQDLEEVKVIEGRI